MQSGNRSALTNNNESNQTSSISVSFNPTESNSSSSESNPPSEQHVDNPLRQDAFTAIRFQEETGILMMAIIGIITELADADESQASNISSYIGAILGASVASGYFLIRKRISAKWARKLETRQINMWARRFKTSFVFGQNIGNVIGDFLPLPPHLPGMQMTQKILSKVIGYALGIICGVGGVIFFSGELSPSGEKYLKIGRDSWTKYGKAGLVYGSSVGAIVGGLIGAFLLPHWGMMLGTTVGGSIGAVAGFVVSMTAVPLINLIRVKLFNKTEGQDNTEHKFNRLKVYVQNLFSEYRTNYIRAGMTWGSSIGSLVGGILGAFVFPVLGPIGGAAFGGAIGSVIGGVVLGIAGPVIGQYLSKDSANTYDYGIRTAALMGGNMGMGEVVIPFAPPVGVVAPGAGSAAWGLIGAIREFYHGRKLKVQEKKDEDHVLPWTTRVASGLIAGSGIGGLIGLAFPPFGVFIGSGVGGLVGGVVAAVAEPLLKRLGWWGKKSEEAQQDQIVEREDSHLDNEYLKQANSQSEVSRDHSIEEDQPSEPIFISQLIKNTDKRKASNSNQHSNFPSSFSSSTTEKPMTPQPSHSSEKVTETPIQVGSSEKVTETPVQAEASVSAGVKKKLKNNAGEWPIMKPFQTRRNENLYQTVPGLLFSSQGTEASHHPINEIKPLASNRTM